MPPPGEPVHDTPRRDTEPTTSSRRPQVDTALFLPIPDEKGIQDTKELYRTKFNKEITDDEAYTILSRLMKWIYLLSELEAGSFEMKPGEYEQRLKETAERRKKTPKRKPKQPTSRE